MKVKILNDIKTTGKNNTIYAFKGETLNVYSVHGEVLIVEGRKQKFPVNKNEVLIIKNHNQ